MISPDSIEQLRQRLPAPTDRAGLEKVAEASGVPYHTLLKIVRGETKDPRLSTYLALSQCLEQAA